ncbi:MAG: N-acetyltransferase family protein [Phycisphaerales bacterium]
MTEPIIRLAGAGDLDAICAIYNREVETSICTFDTEPRTGERASRWFEQYRHERFPLTVCDVGGEVAGWASISKWSDRCAYDKAGETSVYVHAAHRGRGYARLLYADLIERARTVGYRVLLARLAIPNPSTERLHESVGFRDIGIMRNIGEKFGRLIDVRFMDLQLDEPD